MDRPLPPIVFNVGPNKSLTVSASQHADFSGAVRVSPAEAAQYRVVPSLVADAERRAMVFQQSAKAGTTAETPARVVNAEPNPAALKQYVAWVVEAREDLAAWDPTSPNRDDDRSPSALIEEHRRQQQRALDNGADARIIDGIELKPPAGGLARDAERRLLQAVLAGQQVRITA